MTHSTPRTTASVLTAWSSDIPAVPALSRGFVCECCLGPVTDHPQCFSCHAFFHLAGAPAELRSRIVPMTAALSPSRWYSALATYKGFQPELGAVLASVAHHFMTTHADRIAVRLGGPPDLVSIVPSKRGVTFEEQSLRKALVLVATTRAALQQTLEHVPLESVPRRGYNPRAFKPVGETVVGKRVLLVEDAWVTGATAVSAAGSLVEAGAAEVLVLPIARVIDAGFWPVDHPYRIAMRELWVPSDRRLWPRDSDRVRGAGTHDPAESQ